MKKILLLSLYATTICLGSQKNNSNNRNNNDEYYTLSYEAPSALAKATDNLSKAIDLKAAVEALKLQDSVKQLTDALNKFGENMEMKKIAESLNLEKLKLTETATTLSDGLKNLGKGLDTKAIAEGVEKSTAFLAKSLENGVNRMGETADKAVIKIAEQTKQATKDITAASVQAIQEFADAFNFAKLENLAAHIAIRREDSLRLGLCASTACSAGSCAWQGIGCGNACVLGGSLILLYPDKAKELAQHTGKMTRSVYRRAVKKVPRLEIVGNSLETCWKTLTATEDAIAIRPKTPITASTVSVSELAQAPQNLPSTSSTSDKAEKKRGQECPEISQTNSTNQTAPAKQECYVHERYLNVNAVGNTYYNDIYTNVKIPESKKDI